MGDIDLRNPQDTWKQIGKIFNIRKRQPHGTETVSAEQFYEYFKQQNAAPTNGDQTDLEDTGVIEEEAGPLDYAISEEEIDFAIKKLKLNKAPGCDKILNEVLKTGNDIIKGHLLELFNRILINLKALFLAELTDFPQLVHVKSWKKKTYQNDKFHFKWAHYSELDITRLYWKVLYVC